MAEKASGMMVSRIIMTESRLSGSFGPNQLLLDVRSTIQVPTKNALGQPLGPLETVDRKEKGRIQLNPERRGKGKHAPLALLATYLEFLNNTSAYSFFKS